MSLAALLAAGGASAADVATAQARMLAEIARDFRATGELTGEREMLPEIVAALSGVPRHRFVKDDDRNDAYLNRPLSIGHGQTISQPFIVALMTQLARPAANHRVLEIGTGSGYQAAVLARLVAQVYSVEIVAPLAARASATLAELGYGNVEVRVGDGNLGWPEAAPFDSIVVTAAGQLPPALVEQLAPGGRLIIPLELAPGMQELTVVTRTPDGGVARHAVLPVRFVPLTGDN